MRPKLYKTEKAAQKHLATLLGLHPDRAFYVGAYEFKWAVYVKWPDGRNIVCA